MNKIAAHVHTNTPAYIKPVVTSCGTYSDVDTYTYIQIESFNEKKMLIYIYIYIDLNSLMMKMIQIYSTQNTPCGTSSEFS